MSKFSKTKLLIIALYLICLLFYVLMLYITNINMEQWDRVLKKLKLEHPIDMNTFTFLHIHLCYFILSTYFMLKYLNISIINKIPGVIIHIIAFSLLLTGVLKYYSVKYYSTMISVTGLLYAIIRDIGSKISKNNYCHGKD